MIAESTCLADTILDRIAIRTCRRIRGLDVDLADDSIVLHGQATSYHVKQLAQHTVRELLPSVRIQNAIRVD